MFDLTDCLIRVYGDRQSDPAFDLDGALTEVLGGVGLCANDAGGVICHTGADAVLRSPLRIGGAATIALLAKSFAAAVPRPE